MEHAFNLASFAPEMSYAKKNPTRIIVSKWDTANKNKSLQGRAIDKDRNRKYGLEFDNMTDCYDEDYTNILFRCEMKIRLKTQQQQKLRLKHEQMVPLTEYFKY